MMEKRKKIKKRVLCLLLSLLVLLGTCVPGAAKSKQPVTLRDLEKKLYADAYILTSLDNVSEPLVLQKNAEKIKYPASLTKIVTAVVVLNQVKDIKQQTTVQGSALEALKGSGAQTANLKAGQRVSIEQLLYLAMVYSACDACRVLGEAVAGSVPKFVDMMNEWVASIGCKHTHFVNPEGLHHKKQYSCAEDLLRITKKALQNAVFTKIAQTKQYSFAGTAYYHTNRLLHRSWKEYYYPYAKGIKTGYTKQAGRCLIAKASKEGQSYLAIILDAPLKVTKDKKVYNTSYFDAKTLFEWAFLRLKIQTVQQAFVPVTTVQVKGAKNCKECVLVSPKAVKLLLTADVDITEISVHALDPPEQLKAPFKKGKEVCRAQVIYEGKVLATISLVTDRDAELSAFSKARRAVTEWLTNIFSK